MKSLLILMSAAIMLTGCVTSKIIDLNSVRVFDDPSLKLRCYELIDSKRDPHFVCVKTDK